ncbi:BREX-1 system adenine-specific DNA-methyltransferase PglX [Vibrio splendidus]|uniref:BREX-1 system adenine-specific DNA-methyltransferase PglX n=1 Tax=Vibrio splendidus TaxID=29497 RepID=UPI002468BDCE|nr:BREX-1 system adenine-specific DNA-methyltransferase PglX [Vibrio splendidus]MDH6018862.1 BREX-1 system adenine-specific DNA-methyltransferase PglX [Vibrio splendidus]
MNTNKLKAYAPKARIAFMEAVMKRAAVLGIYENKISEATTQGTDTIIDGRVFTRKQGQQRQQLVNRLKALGGGKDGYNQFINEMAFTWFNRFTAIRFMEVNEYLDHGFRVLSKKADAEFGEGFEILSHATDVAAELGLEKSKIVEMVLAGDKEDQLYKDLLLGQCHQLSTIMPFMFEKLDDATELLLPDNLTKSDSILKELINDIPEDNWQEIEVIGWLYQFYISEHKDAVMGKVVKKEDIPAATQLFTPNWIVKYLVQNSLGHQWLSTYPDSELKDKMEYYITPAEQSDEVIAQLKAITPTSLNPEDLKIIDAAMGSGHILVEVYDLLREIYLEQGYRTKEIPELILTKNIYGLDIDDRACQLASFALLMKAREDDRRIFKRIEDNDIKLNLYSLQSTEHFNVNQLWADLDLEGNLQAGQTDDLFTQNEFKAFEIPSDLKPYYELLEYLKLQFLDAKNLGSLIEIDNKYLSALTSLKAKLEEAENSSNPTTKVAVETVLPIVSQALVLATKYDCAVKNPPYLGSKGMNKELKDFGKKFYPNSKSDLFALFMERSFNLLKESGYNAQVNMQSWMFLSSFEKMRESLLDTKTFITMAHLGARAFGQISGEVVQTTAWVLNKNHIGSFQPSFLRMIDGNENDKQQALLTKTNVFTEITQYDFKKISGSPIAYWLPQNSINAFTQGKLEDSSDVAIGMKTGDNEKFVRYWFELDISKIGFNFDSINSISKSPFTWFPYIKGGSYRKWYGNHDLVLNWEENGNNIKNHKNKKGIADARIRPSNFDKYCTQGIDWSFITSGRFGVRQHPQGSFFDVAGSSLFSNDIPLEYYTGYLNSGVASDFLHALNPTLNMQIENIKSLPSLPPLSSNSVDLISCVKRLVSLSKLDWDTQEISWNYNKNKVIKEHKSIRGSYKSMREIEVSRNQEFSELENYNNKYFSNMFSVTQEEDSNNINKYSSLNSNTSYKYNTNNSDCANLEGIYKSDTICEFISHSIGNMMGRYSLDREGLVYAHSENKRFNKLVEENTYRTFPADDDGIVPLAAQEWLFEDDATVRFREFVKTVWGEEHLSENLEFVAESLCLDAIKPKNNESSMDTIRRYFSTQFYKDHLKTYKKRPIYWLFSSGKEKAFECLVYLHRYNESTLARMRTEYVTPLMGKMEAQHKLQSELEQSASSTAEKKRLQKEIKSIEKKQAELRSFDEELKHLAEMKISIDLDNGVKVNYGKFGNLLHDVKGIHGKKPETIK